MFKHLLVPLDGSSLAESALPAAKFLSQRLHASVTLIHVIEQNAPKEIHSEHHLTEADEAARYLEKVAVEAFPPGSEVEIHVHSAQVDDVARSIVDHAEEFAPDLIIMCTHGRGGMRDLLFGSIAQQVIAFKKTPVLLVRPTEEQSQNFTCEKILVPLDGNPEHEQGLTAGVELSDSLGASLHLVMVVPTFGTLTGEQAAAARLLPGTTQAMLDATELGAEEYLRNCLETLKDRSSHLTAEVVRGDPAMVIIETASQAGADLIVLGTHGKAGTEAFWSGSVAPKIITRSQVPLLLVPVNS